MTQFLVDNLRWLVTLLGGVLIGLGLHGFYAKHRQRRLHEEHAQETDNLRSLLTERAARVTAVESQLSDLQIAHDEASAGLAHARGDIGALRMRIADLEPQAQRLIDCQEELRQKQSAWESERADLAQRLDGLRQRALEQEQAASLLEETRNNLRFAETRYFALQSEHKDNLSLMEKKLRDYEAKDQHDMSKLRSRIAELEPQARMATDWQARHDILQSRANENEMERDRLRRRVGELEARVTQLDDGRQRHEGMSAQLAAREQRIRELENDLSRLRQRVLELEPLHGELQIRDQKLHEIKAARDEELLRLRGQIMQLEARAPVIVEVSEAAAARAPVQVPSADAAHDDLTLIYGVGPKLAHFLHGRGVHSFRQIAHWTAEEVTRWEELLPEFNGRIQREGWVRSARAEHIRKYGSEP